MRSLLSGAVPEDPRMFPLPQTFGLDKERLIEIRKHMFSVIDEDIYVSRLKSLMNRLSRSEHDTNRAVEHLRRILPVISRHSSSEQSVIHVATELVRIATAGSMSGQSSEGHDIRHSSFDWHGLYRESDVWAYNLVYGSTMPYRLHMDVVETNLIQRVFSMMELYANMSSAQLWQSLVARPILALSMPGYSYHRTPRFEFVCRKIAHVALVHWRVWGPILYLATFEGAAGSRGESSLAGTGVGD